MDDSLQRLFDAVLAARARDPALSRTSKLFQDGIEKIAKKLAIVPDLTFIKQAEIIK